MRRADHRPHRDAGLRPVADPERPRRLHETVPRLRVRRADRQHHASGEAALAGAAVEGLGDDVDRPVEIRVRHDHDEILRAAESLDALAGVRRPPVHRPRDLRRADERDGADAGMVADRLDDVAPSVDQVDDARRQRTPREARAILRCVRGTCSEGLTMNVFPVATAKGRNHSGTIAGKLKGAIAAQTPRGCRRTWQSIPGPTFSRP